jgi:hypothetical protein
LNCPSWWQVPHQILGAVLHQSRCNPPTVFVDYITVQQPGFDEIRRGPKSWRRLFFEKPADGVLDGYHNLDENIDAIKHTQPKDSHIGKRRPTYFSIIVQSMLHPNSWQWGWG